MQFYGTYYGMNDIQDYKYTLQSAWVTGRTGPNDPFHFSSLEEYRSICPSARATDHRLSS